MYSTIEIDYKIIKILLLFYTYTWLIINKQKKVLSSPLSLLQLFGDGRGLSIVSEVLTETDNIMLVNSILSCKALHFPLWKLRLQNLRDKLLSQGKVLTVKLKMVLL